MEWMNRGPRPGQTNSQPAAPIAPVSQSPINQSNNSKRSSLNGLSLATLGLLFSGAILVLAVIAFAAFGGTNTTASKYVDEKKMQAVFLNGGQVYFGNIKSANDKFMRVSNIYYLRVNQTVQPDTNAATTNNDDISLVKLGCELHGPQDQMVINQSQVIFWENLKDDGQVAKAVAEYIKQNPNGQQCNANATGTGAGSSAAPLTGTPSTPPTATPPTATTPRATTPTAPR